jgi:hypothetical protein
MNGVQKKLWQHNFLLHLYSPWVLSGGRGEQNKALGVYNYSSRTNKNGELIDFYVQLIESYTFILHVSEIEIIYYVGKAI